MLAQGCLRRLSAASLLLASLVQAAPASAADAPPRCRSIQQKLSQPVSLTIQQAPLRQVVSDLRDLAGINIAIDKPALEEEGVCLDSPVTVDVSDVSLQTALNLILHDVHLTCAVKDDVLYVTTSKHARGKLTTVTYQVADLVIPIQGSKATEQDKLIALIQATINPNSWAPVGGAGTVDYFPLGMALVVNQTPDVQEQVAELLAALRRLQDHQVALEVRFVTVSDETLEAVCKGIEKKQLKPAPGCGDAIQPTWTAFLSDKQVQSALERIQGDTRSNVMQAPKLTVFNGQHAAINVTDTQSFVTAVHCTTKGGKVVCAPHTEQVPLGVQLAVTPTISADRRFVRVKIDSTLTSLASAEVPLFPVAVPVSPETDGEEGKPAVFTQFIQQPQINRVAINTTLAVPDGGTVLLGGIKQLTETRTEHGTPVLSKVPYVNCLFKNVGYGRETRNVVVMVTPRIIVQEEEEVRQTGCQESAKAGGTGKLGGLLRQYHQACAAGHTDEARKLAIECLAIDPACFHTK
jgi:type II secretory pathway component GspD/PulD (secretin)